MVIPGKPRPVAGALVSDPTGLMTEDVRMKTKDPESILFLCTANICRSPMAEILLRAALSAGCPELVIRSAGFLSEGSSADKRSVWAMEKLGLQLTAHVSAHVSSAVEPMPDLVLVMAREHLRMLSDVEPSVLKRAFTLKEFVRLAGIEGERHQAEPLSDYVGRVAAGRSVSAITSSGHEEDIADPVGHRKAAFWRCASELKELVSELSGYLCPSGG